MVIIDLCELEPNQKGTVVHVGGMGGVRQRIMDMGLVNGAEVEVLRVAPLGDPMELSLRGYNLSLRKSEAASIQVATHPVLPLTQAPFETDLQIVSTNSGFGLIHRLDKMGLTAGTIIQRLPAEDERGPQRILKEGQELEIGHRMAERMIVQLESPAG